MNGLTKEDWVEIAAAVDSKRLRIIAGDYGESDTDCDMPAWAAHLETIIDKIGPDGENMSTSGAILELYGAAKHLSEVFSTNKNLTEAIQRLDKALAEMED